MQLTETIIFIDIDGPLLPGKQWWNTDNRAIRKEHGNHWYLKDELRFDIKFDPVAIEFFKLWFKYSGAKAVIASNWKRWTGKADIIKIFKNNGLDLEPLLHENWQTPKAGCYESRRGHEIRAWLEDNHADNFLIVDDDTHIEQVQVLEGQYTLIDFETGISSNDFRSGLKILDIELKDVMEHEFGIIPMTSEEKDEYEKSLDLLMSCMV